MKLRIFLIVMTALLMLTACAMPLENSDEEDGGVRHYVDTKAPKVIESTCITMFSCEFSTLNLATDLPIAGKIFTLTASESGGNYEARNREEVLEERCFTPNSEFFAQLQTIVSEYDLAQHNGLFYSVSGLPPGYGIELDIQYESGESIQASDNQSCFLPLEAMEKLVALFAGE